MSPVVHFCSEDISLLATVSEHLVLIDRTDRISV